MKDITSREIRGHYEETLNHLKNGEVAILKAKDFDHFVETCENAGEPNEALLKAKENTMGKPGEPHFPPLM